jgi:predicted homoserine dehydrogenase-like protein
MGTGVIGIGVIGIGVIGIGVISTGVISTGVISMHFRLAATEGVMPAASSATHRQVIDDHRVGEETDHGHASKRANHDARGNTDDNATSRVRGIVIDTATNCTRYRGRYWR